MNEITKKYFIGGLKGAGKELIKIPPLVSILLGFLEGAEGTLPYKNEERVKELLLTLNENGKLTDSLLNNEYFIDGLVKTLQRYLFEYSKKKRLALAKVLIGFSESNEPEEFNIEKYFDLISKLDTELITILGKISKHKLWGYDEYMPPKEGDDGYGDLKYLESIGLIVCYKWNEIENKTEYEGDNESGFSSTGKTLPSIKEYTDADITRLGKEILKYILSE